MTAKLENAEGGKAQRLANHSWRYAEVMTRVFSLPVLPQRLSQGGTPWVGMNDAFSVSITGELVQEASGSRRLAVA